MLTVMPSDLLALGQLILMRRSALESSDRVAGFTLNAPLQTRAGVTAAARQPPSYSGTQRYWGNRRKVPIELLCPVPIHACGS